MKSSKGLQKFTISESKIQSILELEVITKEEFDKLNKLEKAKVSEILTNQINTLQGVDRDSLISKIENIIGQQTRNQIWEVNHNKILVAISSFIQENGRMPSKIEMAENSGLSRPTINKHFKEYSTHPEYLEQMEHFKFLSNKLLAKLYQFAIGGDTSAAKLFFNVIGGVDFNKSLNNTLIQTQNNLIQINGMVLSQDSIKYLSQEQLNIIEEVLKAAMMPKENL